MLPAGRGGATAGDGDLWLSLGSGIYVRSGRPPEVGKGRGGRGFLQDLEWEEGQSQQRSKTGCREMSSEGSRRQAGERHQSYVTCCRKMKEGRGGHSARARCPRPWRK